MNRPRVLLADDHRIVAEGLRSLLEPEFDLIGIVEDGQALVDAVRDLDPDVVVADISMPTLNGLEAVDQFKKSGARALVIFLTMHPDVTYAARAFEVGASGFVLKHSAPSELITAIREALRGRTFITSLMNRDLVQPLIGSGRSRKITSKGITLRQREVLRLLSEGHTARQIASVLGISSRTVEYHKYRLMESLDLRTQADLIQYVIKHDVSSN